MKHTVICILGMHRSGTSCLTGSLSSSGLFPGKVSTWNEDNSRGNQENQAIMRLNNILLENNSGTWESPPKEVSWNSDHCQQRDQLLSEFNAQATVWMFKDPRTLLTLNFWREGIKSINMNCYFVGTFRHPNNVALSLYQRSQIPLGKGIQLWVHYNTRLLQILQAEPFPLICFDLPKKQYQEQLLNTINNLNKKLPAENQLSVSAAQEFYSEKLVNHQDIATFLTSEDECPPPIQEENRSLQEAAETLYKELYSATQISKSNPFKTSQKLYIPFDNSITACKQALEAQSDHPQLYFMLGNAQRCNSDFQSAAVSYQKAIKLNHPQSFNVYKVLGKTLEEAGKWDEAIANYQQALKTYFGYPCLYLSLYKALTKAQRIDEAEKTLLKLIEQRPNIAQYHVILGNLYFQRENSLPNAIDAFQQALTLDPTHYIAQKRLGVAFMRQNKLGDSLTTLLAAQKSHPQQVDMYAVLAQCYQRQQNWQAAATNYELAISNSSDPAFGIYFNLGNVLQHLGQYQSAKAAYEQALQKNPAHPKTQKRLKKICRLV